MTQRLYDDLAHLWGLISPPDTYRDEAKVYAYWLEDACSGSLETLLELGSGGGHLAASLPTAWQKTLVDASEPMLEVSRGLHPDATHVCGDFRTLQLDRQFDAVLLHDAVMYILSPEDLAATFATAFRHLRSGGAFLVLPDTVKEDFREHAESGGTLEGETAVQLMEWHWDPDPSDHTFNVDFAVVIRRDGKTECVHEQHQMGLYARREYVQLLRQAGFEMVPAPLSHLDTGRVFLARKP